MNTENVPQFEETHGNGDAVPVELLDVARVAKEGPGFWAPCSGCYETNEGYPPTGAYFSPIFKCHLGNGCSECGGIGAIWDTTDYDAMATHMAQSPAAPGAAAAAQPVLPDLEALDIAFSRGVCVALQVITTMDCGTTWREVVQTCDEAKLLHFAAHVEPEEWELAGFAQYAREELGRDKPAAQAQGAVPPSGGEHG